MSSEAELEIAVLRHEVTILRRQVKRPIYRASDSAFLAAASRILPREAWGAFLVRPETLLRWHRQLVRRKWTKPHRPPGRPFLRPEIRELIVRLGGDTPGGLPAHPRRAAEARNEGLCHHHRHRAPPGRYGPGSKARPHVELIHTSTYSVFSRTLSTGQGDASEKTYPSGNARDLAERVPCHAADDRPNCWVDGRAAEPFLFVRPFPPHEFSVPTQQG